jgi:hypothetical protein
VSSTASSFDSTYSSDQGYCQKPNSSTGANSSHSSQASKSQHLGSGKTTTVNDFFKHFLQTEFYPVFTETIYIRHRSQNQILLEY